MNTSTNPEPRRPLRTSDLAAAGTTPTRQEEVEGQQESTPSQRGAAESSEGLEALFAPDLATQYRTRWSEVQSGFVDDPRRAVAQGDELVAEVMRSLAESFAHERERLEDELSQTGEASTETLRVGLRRYRSFFERLLSL
jgi:hypothetical protein